MRTVFVDVGAHTGTSVRDFCRYQTDLTRPNVDKYGVRDLHDLHILAFEPSTESFQRLKQLVEELPFSHQLFNALALDYDGEIDFCCDEKTLQFYTLPEYRFMKDPSRLPVVRKPCVDLARVMLECCRPDDYVVLKMDVEGSEYKLIPHLLREKVFDHVNEFFLEVHKLSHLWREMAKCVLSVVRQTTLVRFNVTPSPSDLVFFDGPTPNHEFSPTELLNMWKRLPRHLKG